MDLMEIYCIHCHTAKDQSLKALKSLVSYALLLAAGISLGLMFMKLPKLFERGYAQADLTPHFSHTSKKVILYGTSTCPYCAKARAYLNESKISFEDIDIEKSELDKKRYSQLKVEAVPVILIGDRVIVGFKPKMIEAAINEINYLHK